MKIKFNCDEKNYNNKDLYDLLIATDFSEIANSPVIAANADGTFFLMFRPEDWRDVLLALNDEIVVKGMDNQNTVNETGKMLYWLYDEIIIQKRKQQTT